MVEVLLADELVIHLEAATVLEGLVELRDLHLISLMLVNTMPLLFRSMMMCLLVEMLDDDGVTGADLEVVLLDALAEEELDCLFLAHFDVRLHLDALTAPEIVKVLLAEPLLARLHVELVLCLEQDTLVVLDVLR